MKVKALRGICVGVGQHLVAGDIADLDPAMVTFLSGINAVERYEEPAPQLEESDDKPITSPAKSVVKEK